MKKVKLFAYLDEYKMYSISSQIFEGLTEYALRYSHRDAQQREEQKGPVGSGRILADIVSEQAGTAERRFLHDYAYTLFEDKLFEDDRVVAVDQMSGADVSKQLETRAFIKVTGNVLFNDVRQITKTVSEFNVMGEALSFVSNYGSLGEAIATLEEQMKSTKDSARRNALKQQLKALMDPKALAQANNLYHDPMFTEKLAYMLKYGYEDEFEVQISLSDAGAQRTVFSAILDRENFTESERMLVRKYARKSESVFTLFGVVTQKGSPLPADSDPAVDEDASGVPQAGAIRTAIHTLVGHMGEIEDTFTGRWSNEIIIDPIALYREL